MDLTDAHEWIITPLAGRVLRVQDHESRKMVRRVKATPTVGVLDLVQIGVTPGDGVERTSVRPTGVPPLGVPPMGPRSARLKENERLGDNHWQVNCH